MAIQNPIWKGNTSIDVVKTNSLTIMEHHANKQLEKLSEHAKLLVEQAKDIEKRVELSRKISRAEYGFKPIHLREYYLYQQAYNGIREDKLTLTLISPEEWKDNCPYGDYVATVRQLGDSTWEEIKEDGVYEECSKRDSENHGT